VIADDIGFGELLIGLLIFYLLLQCLIIFVVVVVDVFRSHDLSGAKKALWALFLLVMPIIGVIVYFLARGDTMGERHMASLPPPPPVAAPASELQAAANLRDSGEITQEQYDKLKAQLLG